MAVDYGIALQRRTHLQNAADAAALASVRQLGLVQQDSESVSAAVAKAVRAIASRPDSIQIEAQVIDATSLRVTLREKITNLLGRLLNYPNMDVQVTAVARTASTKLCMLALETAKANAVSLKKRSRLTAAGCSIYSNSTDPSGINAEDFAQIDADTVCSAGGVDGKGHFARAPVTDCPAVTDPLAYRVPPSYSGCDFNKTEIKAGASTLSPGVYCGGLKISEGAVVVLTPGVYVIVGGKLTVDKGAILDGKGVGFYLAGKDSSFEFGYDSSISLSAPKSGEMAGLLFFDDRAGKWDKHKIFSNDARLLLGTIYLPNGSLYIDSQKPIADKSAYTVLVTRTLELYDGPNLVLNTNYEGSSVPVPKGVGPLGARVTLVK